MGQIEASRSAYCPSTERTEAFWSSGVTVIVDNNDSLSLRTDKIGLDLSSQMLVREPTTKTMAQFLEMLGSRTDLAQCLAARSS